MLSADEHWARMTRAEQRRAIERATSNARASVMGLPARWRAAVLTAAAGDDEKDCANDGAGEAET